MSDYLISVGKKAKKASYETVILDTKIINDALMMMAEKIEQEKTSIIAENAKDVEAAKSKLDNVMLDRLTLTEARVQDLADNLRLVARLESPLNKVEYSYQSLKGFRVRNISVPLGVILMIYEARPNVTIEAMSLSLKSGNAIILRGSSSTLNTNKKLVELVSNVGKEVGLPDNFVQLIETTSYDDVTNLVKMNDYIDVVIPRGGAKLIQNVVTNATVPIIETGVGNNFAYVDASAEYKKAVEVIVNAKAHRVTVCNSLEKVLIHKDVAQEFITELEKQLKASNVEIRAHKNIIDRFSDVNEFSDDELSLEYLNYIIGIKEVSSIDEAIEIINEYSTKHSNIILSTSFYDIEKFTKQIDSACVFVNVSSRFSDGVEFGLGSEIGISTQKLHARGPMGLKALTTTKSIIVGEYEIKE
ncbi:glutamate-5-semialdehyde dehydrogenase [Bacilli bacterium PM5-3]|nr:glutamate-5-semialdehyde dehydrogenase [Bacilli bacterium PM5-3]MDH6604311.1 glutamate-5-semialdehyde dehydrogenase [Bacilli bacterium PM5-9]